MFGTATGRKARRNAKAKVAATAAAAAMGVGLAAAPPAAADLNIPVITQDPVFTAGFLAGILAEIAPPKLTIPLNMSIPVPVIGNVNIGDLELVLDNVASNPPSIYNANNSYAGWINAGGTRYRFPATLGIGNGAYDLVNAYRAELASVQGITQPGYSPFVAGPSGSVNFTSQELILVNNPYRPNGGLLSRFAAPLNTLGIDTSMPAAGKNSSASGKITLNTGTLDIAWAYSPLADLPVTLNPFSVVNSLFAAVPLNLLGGVQLANLNIEDVGLSVASTLGILYKLSGGLVGVGDGAAFYGTLVPDELPILEPLRLPAQIINLIAGREVVGTPLADALQPALKILVNIGYSDVVTPSEGGTYDRTFTTSSTPESLLSVNPLTPEQWSQVPRDVITALIVGFQQAFPILRFGQPAPVLTTEDNHLAISYTAPTAATAAPVAGVDTDDSSSIEPAPVAAPGGTPKPLLDRASRAAGSKVPGKTEDASKQSSSAGDSSRSASGSVGHSARSARAAG
jgi:hypothetical protein